MKKATPKMTAQNVSHHPSGKPPLELLHVTLSTILTTPVKHPQNENVVLPLWVKSKTLTMRTTTKKLSSPVYLVDPRLLLSGSLSSTKRMRRRMRMLTSHAMFEARSSLRMVLVRLESLVGHRRVAMAMAGIRTATAIAIEFLGVENVEGIERPQLL
jgi:hypothetical protein